MRTTTTPEPLPNRIRRRVASLQTWWLRLFFLQILVSVVWSVPNRVDLPLLGLWLALAFVRPPRADDRPPMAVPAPVTGRWVAINSPGTKVPSHGVRAHGQAFAVDVLHPRDGEAPPLGWGVRQRRPEEFSCFGEPVRASLAGTVVAAVSTRRDHRARSSWPGILYMFTIEGAARELMGSRGLLGNHVVVESDGVYAAYAHLRRGSLTVAVGDRVEVGHVIGEVGNSGNTAEPHLHFQLMDRAEPTSAAGLPFRWSDIEQSFGEVDQSWSSKLIDDEITPGLPANFQIFTARPVERHGAAPPARPGP